MFKKALKTLLVLLARKAVVEIIFAFIRNLFGV